MFDYVNITCQTRTFSFGFSVVGDAAAVSCSRVHRQEEGYNDRTARPSKCAS